MEAFGARLRAAMDIRGPLCAGIDPHPALLSAWGLPDDVRGLASFASTVVEALSDRVAVLKPQSAFFERFGSRGVAVLERATADARAAGALVIMDGKRGDIGSTMTAYAQAYLDPSSPLFADALTVSPYLGFGTLRPAIDTALRHGAGVFVLALTSNPEGPSVQHARGPDGRTVAGAILAQIAACNAGAVPLGSIGAVVGATVDATAGATVGASVGGIRENLAVNGPLLAPGLGAQGASPADLRRVFGEALGNVVPAMSRELLRHGPSVAALRAAAASSVAALAAALR